MLELGLDSFGDVTVGADGKPLSHGRVIRDLIDEAVLADSLGVDFIGVGEHHRSDFAVSSPEIVLAAIAGKTKRIKLGTAVTVLSSDDPVRVYERFATLDAVSNGRAEVILGRGSFTESFALFGFDLGQYEELFEERLELFSRLLDEKAVTWAGKTRASLTNQEVYPKTESGRIKTWIGVGGSPESVIRAAKYGMPMTLAIIGGDPARFAPFVDLYERACAEFKKPVLPIGVHSPGYIADTDAAAGNEMWPHYEGMRNRIGAERGWGVATRREFDQEVAVGSLYVGSPETVARKIAATIRVLGAGRFDMKYSAGTLPHALMMRSIELYGSKVMPMVREHLK